MITLSFNTFADTEEELVRQMESIKKSHEMFAEQIKQQIAENSVTNKLSPYINEYCPEFLEKLPEMIQDEELVSALKEMRQDRDLLIYFVGINIFIFIISWIWARSYRMHSVLSFAFWRRCLTRFIVINGARLYVVYYFFGPLLMPFREYLVC